MEWGEILTRGLAALAALCYLLRVLFELWGLARWNRWLWTLGCAALWLHIGAAFHFVHDWSHADALRQTAEQTEKLTGWAFGGGVYFNYAFAMLWLMDVVLWWRKGWHDPSQSLMRFGTMHAIFAFMMVNATVVFGPVYWRYVGIIFAGLLIVVYALQRRNRASIKSSNCKH